MAEFTPIETQEELDKIITARLTREAKKYADYDDLKAKASTYESKISELTSQHEEAEKKLASQVEDLQKQIKGYETNSVKMRIALDAGLPYEMAGRLNGDDEESIRADAQKLAAFVAKPAAPAFNPEPVPTKEGAINKALRDMASKI